MNFKDIDNVIALGKWVFYKVPEGNKCNGCPVLDTKQRVCGLRPSVSLCFANEVIYKDECCPVRKEANHA